MVKIKVTTKIKEEIGKLLPPTIYFFVILHIVAFIRVLMNRSTSIALPTSASITLAALILGKSVLIADMLPFINRFPEKPLIWNVSWKTIIYFFVALVIHYLERLYDFWRQASGFVAANERLLSEIVWPHFWAIQILLALLIAMYCVMSELVRAIGGHRMKVMFFGPLPARGH
jgi:hypothetical protein